MRAELSRWFGVLGGDGGDGEEGGDGGTRTTMWRGGADSGGGGIDGPRRGGVRCPRVAHVASAQCANVCIATTVALMLNLPTLPSVALALGGAAAYDYAGMLLAAVPMAAGGGAADASSAMALVVVAKVDDGTLVRSKRPRRRRARHDGRPRTRAAGRARVRYRR